MSRADVKRMRGGANIYSRGTCANDQIYTSADYSAVYSFRGLGFNEAYAERERERQGERERVAYHKIYQRALSSSRWNPFVSVTTTKGAQYSKDEQRDS